MTPHDAQSDDGSIGRRQLLTKMAAGGAIVWASPLIAKTAYAQASGTCLESGILRWSDAPWSGWGSGNGQSVSGTIGTTGVMATVTTTLVGFTPAFQFTVADHTRHSDGGVSYVEFGQTAGNTHPTSWAQAHRTVRIAFSAPVTNVQFHIRDIDRENQNNTYTWDDRIGVTSDGTVVRNGNADLTGPGTGTANTDAVYRVNTTNLSFPSSTQGRANFAVSGNVTWLEIHYWNGPRNPSNTILQQTFLSQISFGCA